MLAIPRRAWPFPISGRQVRVKFEDDLKYPGTVSDYNRETAMYRINYDDGVVEWSNVVQDPNVELLKPPSSTGSQPRARARRGRKD